MGSKKGWHRVDREEKRVNENAAADEKPEQKHELLDETHPN
jgi:hypothetical protein